MIQDRTSVFPKAFTELTLGLSDVLKDFVLVISVRVLSIFSKISADPGLLKIRHSHRFVAVVIQFLFPHVEQPCSLVTRYFNGPLKGRRKLRIQPNSKLFFAQMLRIASGFVLAKKIGG